MYKISSEIIKFIEETKKKSRVEFIVEGKLFDEAKIQGVSFQGDALSSLLFVITMMPLNH